MKLRRYIAFVLCTLYIAATAGVALASVTCKCIGMRRGAVEHLCQACSCHTAAARPAALDDRTDAACGSSSELSGCRDVCGCAIGGGCDCTRHSTKIELYTSSHSDDNDSEKALRCIVSQLPASLAAECPCPAHLPALRRGVVLPPLPVLREIPRVVEGLRAPPALV